MSTWCWPGKAHISARHFRFRAQQTDQMDTTFLIVKTTQMPRSGAICKLAFYHFVADESREWASIRPSWKGINFSVRHIGQKCCPSPYRDLVKLNVYQIFMHAFYFRLLIKSRLEWIWTRCANFAFFALWMYNFLNMLLSQVYFFVVLISQSRLYLHLFLCHLRLSFGDLSLPIRTTFYPLSYNLCVDSILLIYSLLIHWHSPFCTFA